MSFTITELQEKDINAAADVHYKSWLETYDGLIERDFLDSLSFETKLKIRKRLYNNGNPIGKTYVAFNDNGKVVGFCGAAKSRENYAKGELFAIYVLNEFQRKGVGNRLFDEAKQYLISEKLEPFIVWVLSDNKKACKFYEKQGASLVHKKTEVMGSKEYELYGYIID